MSKKPLKIAKNVKNAKKCQKRVDFNLMICYITYALEEKAYKIV